MFERSKGRAAGAVTALAVLLSACGTTTEERALSGAAIGAVPGAVLGAVTGGLSVAAGTLIGAGAGGATGALTSPDRINLGEPVWKCGFGARARTVTEIQSELVSQGYDPGPIDGCFGPRTASAIRNYQQDHNLIADGHASSELLRHMQSG